jgi:hypothetical protein
VKVGCREGVVEEERGRGVRGESGKIWIERVGERYREEGG